MKQEQLDKGNQLWSEIYNEELKISANEEMLRFMKGSEEMFIEMSSNTFPVSVKYLSRKIKLDLVIAKKKLSDIQKEFDKL